ncbi:MAG: hypothetical protein J6D52_00885 [Clostridia bacterium]|nr:hypothetical protein [Clostridia bacterium]
MKNKYFEIKFNSENGSVASITNINDEHSMNWCIEDGGWGLINYNDTFKIEPLYTREKSVSIMPLVKFNETEDSCTAVYENETFRVTAERFFTDNDCYNERYTIKNLRETDYFLEHGTLGIRLPFNDIYTFADDCMINRCNTHLWCGGNTTYINALKMGVSDINLGLMLTKGAIKSYSVEGTKTNHRGIFILNPDHFELLTGEETVIGWQMFWHKGNDDFLDKAYQYDNFINIEAPQFTVFKNERIDFTVKTQRNLDGLKIYYDGEVIPYKTEENGCRVSFTPKRMGEHRFDIYIDEISTYTEFFVAEDLETLLYKRINFIVDKQQYKREDSPLYGSFLIYDNKEKELVFDSVFRDHNACRERTGMALLIAKYLQTHDNPKFREALDKYVAFVIREVFDTETGEVFDGVRKNVKFKRLYNAPWVTTLFTEMYLLTKDETYLKYVIKVLEHYYSIGGERFYPNGLSMRKTIKAFSESGLKKETEMVKKWYITHVDNIVANGLSYPKHEVNYEQTIVSPAATFVSEIAFVTDDEKYKTEALKHIEILERFSGHQPSFHLNEIAIRFWDDRWFGKERLFGDTFPHYWSCLTARAFTAYYNCSGDEKYKIAAEKCARNCLCLFNDKGEGSCAYVYPFKSGMVKGAFYDEWANDQDFALYFYLIINET